MSVLKNIKRLRKAARMGFLWPGTSRFSLPRKFKWKGRTWSLDTPSENTLNWVFRDLLIDDEYGLERLGPPPKTILDVGANVGMFSLWAGANFPDAAIHAYEPNPSLQQYLSENTRQVGATIHAEGVSGSDGLGSFTKGTQSMVGQCRESETGDIAVVSLRTAIDRIGGSVDLLKLDCEGAEWSILEHAKDFESVGSVRMEYHLTDPKRSTQCLVEAFKRMDFRCTHLSPNQGFGLAWFDR